MKKSKIFLLLSLFSLFSCGERIVYKTQEDMNMLIKQEIWNRYSEFLPDEAQLIEVLPSKKWHWCIIKIRNSYYLYRMNFYGNSTTEVMIPHNYTEK